MNITGIRLLNQHLNSPIFDNPTDVVRHMGAMQAQEYRMMRWAVAMRTKKPSSSSFKKAFDNGSIVRLHLLRGTWQLIAGEDYWWMLDLCGLKSTAVINGWMKANKISIPENEYLYIREILCSTASDLGSATKEDFATALATKGITMDNHRLSYHIRMAELSGKLCSGELLPMKASYSLSESKIPSTPAIDRDEALRKLARKYFQSHSPATFEDYLWWSGMNVSDCRKGMELLGNELRKIAHDGREFYLLEGCRIKGNTKGQTILLAPYDEYIIGYKSRDLSIPANYVAKVHSQNGIFFPVILHDGQTIGNWSPFSKKCNCDFFEEHDFDDIIKEKWKIYQHYIIN